MKLTLPRHSLRTRIIVFCSALLIAVQSIAFLIFNTTSLQIAEAQAKTALESGGLVLQRLLEYRSQQLNNASAVLTADFGFRRVAATGDRDTIRSALDNHGRRIRADLMLLTRSDGTLLGSTGPPAAANLPPNLQLLLASARQTGQASSMVSVTDSLFQVTILPVLAPDLVAWVVLGFAVDQALVDELRALTNLHISFIHQEGGEAALLASSLPDQEQRTLLGAINGELTASTSAGQVISVAGHLTRLMTLESVNDPSLRVILQRPITDTHQHLNQLRNFLILLSLVSILLSVIGIILIANSITRPLRTLADVAENIKAGDYSKAANIAESGEIGLLAESFNLMRDSIATLLRLAYRDHLTNLPNRSMFNDRIAQAIKQAHRRNEPFTLLFIDLNKFKAVNDNYGHDAGDIVLREVSRALLETVRETDTVARLGGDEFAVILVSSDRAAARHIITTIRSQIEHLSIDIGPASVSVGCSIGAATYPQDGEQAQQLMRIADQAMYASKPYAKGARAADQPR